MKKQVYIIILCMLLIFILSLIGCSTKPLTITQTVIAAPNPSPTPITSVPILQITSPSTTLVPTVTITQNQTITITQIPPPVTITLAPTTTTIVPVPTIKETATPTISSLDDLAYIKVTPYFIGYSDDADLEKEGIIVQMVFYNSKSLPITFSNLPLKISLVLRHVTDGGYPIVYQKIYSYDSVSCNQIFSIKIPFDRDFHPISSNPYIMRAEIKVTLPNQRVVDATSQGIAFIS